MTPRLPVGESRCRSCNAIILWVTMVPSGKATPLDAVPSQQGTIDRQPGKIDRSNWYGRVVPKEERDGKRLYVSHFATCGQADSWRRK